MERRMDTITMTGMTMSTGTASMDMITAMTIIIMMVGRRRWGGDGGGGGCRWRRGWCWQCCCGGRFSRCGRRNLRW
jgi:hypothetical protein